MVILFVPLLPMQMQRGKNEFRGEQVQVKQRILQTDVQVKLVKPKQQNNEVQFSVNT